jgi:hypothetical protein
MPILVVAPWARAQEITKGEKMPGDVSLDAPEQSKRFLEAAKAAEADETEKGADRAFKAVVKPRKSKADQ